MNAVQMRNPALTIRQPYAWLVVKGFKPVENRTWSTTYRGPLFIHAAVRLHGHTAREIEQKFGVKIEEDDLRFGGVIGRVDLVDVVTAHPSPWFTGPFGWVLKSPRRLPFRAMRGGQTLFDVPSE